MTDIVFQRTAPSVSIFSTASIGTVSACQTGTYCVMEIAVIGTGAACVHFTDASQTSGTAATTADRTIPGNTVAHEYLPQGAAFVSAIAQAIGTGPTVVFTPGLAKQNI